MKFGFYLPNHGPSARSQPLAKIAESGDKLGYYCMVAGDHILVPNKIGSAYPYTVRGDFPVEDGEYLEQLTLLTFLAAKTKRIRIVPSVMIVPYRNPLLAAKILATLDILCEGRLTLGVGVGWMEEEFQVLKTPPFAERGQITDEYLQIYKELWTSDAPSYKGQYYEFSDIRFLPKPFQKPHPPIWIGGQSRAAIRRAAEIGDGWHPVGAIPAATLEPEELSRNLDALRSHAESVGRDPSNIDIAMKAPIYDPGRSTSSQRRRFSGESGYIIEDVAAYAKIGVTHLIFDIRDTDVEEAVARLGWLAEEVMAHV